MKVRWSYIFCGEEIAASDLKLIAEYRQLLKLQFEVLKKARSLVDEACFQRAVLNALRSAGEELYQTAVASLWELEGSWDGDSDDDDDSPDDIPPDNDADH